MIIRQIFEMALASAWANSNGFEWNGDKNGIVTDEERTNAGKLIKWIMALFIGDVDVCANSNTTCLTVR